MAGMPRRHCRRSAVNAGERFFPGIRGVPGAALNPKAAPSPMQDEFVISSISSQEEAIALAAALNAHGKEED